MDEAERLENLLRRRENEHRELRDISEQALQQLASLEGIGGLFSRLMGSAEQQRTDLEATIETANQRAADVQDQIEDLRDQLRAIRRSEAAARRAERAPTPTSAATPPLASSPSRATPSEPPPPPAEARPTDVAALQEAKRMAHRVRSAIRSAVEENQSESVRRARNGRKPMFGERLSLLEIASDQLGVLDEVRGFQRRSADAEVAQAMADLRRALDRAGVTGWQSETGPGLPGPLHLLNEALILTGATHDRSRFDVADSVERLHELHGQVTLLEQHLDARLSEAC